MPADYAAGDQALYVQSIKDSSPMVTADGKMPLGGPETVLRVLSAFSQPVMDKKGSLDVSKTYDPVRRRREVATAPVSTTPHVMSNRPDMSDMVDEFSARAELVGRGCWGGGVVAVGRAVG